MHMLTLVLSLGLSCGGINATTLDANSTVWNFRTWGRPYRLVSPLLDCSSPERTPIQIEHVWLFSVILTRSGDVYRCQLRWARYWEAMAKLDEDESTRAVIPDGEAAIPCHTWEMGIDPVKLPSLPVLPDLPMTGLGEEERGKETKLIKIAACFHSLVGLTNKGHVLKMNRPSMEAPVWVWIYVSRSERMT